MRLVTYFGFGGTGDVKKYRPEEIEICAWVAGGAAPTTTPSGTAFTSASAVGETADGRIKQVHNRSHLRSGSHVIDFDCFTHCPIGLSQFAGLQAL